MPRIFLTGFSYTGKTETARLVAQRLGWPCIDTDDLIVKKAGKLIHRIFAEDGEARFRELEREAIAEACEMDDAVVATGGGAVMDAGNRQRMARAGFVVCLEASPASILRRLQERAGDATVRPLLQGSDPLEAITRLKESRAAAYATARWTVHTDDLTPAQTADEVLRAHRWLAAQDLFPEASYVVSTGAAVCPGYVGWGVLDGLGQRMREAGLSGTAYVFADLPVFKLYGKRVLQSLKGAGFAVDHHFLQPGEATKTLATAEKAYAWLAQRRAERGHVIVALGGGMAGDLAGFVAATYLRGMPFVQAPTTLLAMVDASIGGKVAVNLPAGKNLVGAFHQPRLVLADVETLSSLPERERIAGWAEVVKHGLILDRQLFDDIRANARKIQSLDKDTAPEIVSRAARVKARVVSQDERESPGGPRTLLNYGHTLGHALEAATGYEGLLHGEAVSIGMTVAAEIARRMGMLDDASARTQREALEAFGLPVKAPAVDWASVRAAMGVDKKVSGGKVRWVLLERIGHAVTRLDVPPEAVEAGIAAVGD
jgi:3-dehydroquinate synthase